MGFHDIRKVVEAAVDVLYLSLDGVMQSSSVVALQRVVGRAPILRRTYRYATRTALPAAWLALLMIASWLNRLFSPAMVFTLARQHLQAFVTFYALFIVYRSSRRWYKALGHYVKEKVALAFGSGHYRRIRMLSDQMRDAETYAQWKLYADEVDVLKGRYRWKDDPESALYDYKRIERMLADIRQLIDAKDVLGIMSYMRSRLLRNIAGTGHKRLFAHLRAGTKRLIEEFQEEVVRALNLVALENTPSVTIRQKLAFFNETRHSMGRSALMLSGGASFGCYHVGVIKALHENRLLPKIISGASAGAIIASWVGAMTDEELDHVTDPGRVNLDLFPPITGAVFRKLYRLLNTGVVFDVRTLARCLRANIGDITFAEAYARSGRVTNIVVAPANSSKEVPRLLNYLTSPDVVLWSAAVASSAIPYFYESVELQMKDSRTGKIVPYYTRGVRWSDGSFHSDLPMKRLAELFNVNMYIVSQVNPHVIPFAVRKEWRVRSIGGVLVHLCTYLGEQLRHTIMLLFQNATLVLPAFGRLTIIPAAFGQTYTGDITILPDFRPSDYLFLLSNPTPERLQDCTRRTEVLTWRKLAEVKHACEIEFALDACVRYMRGAILMSNEVPFEHGAAILGNRLNSWAPDQFAQVTDAPGPDGAGATLTSSSARSVSSDGFAMPGSDSAAHRVLARSGSAGTPVAVHQHGGPGHAALDFHLQNHVLSARGIHVDDLALPASHDASEDVSDSYIP
ncbi:unnamed protein product (mitochondrion) [Plasmodiophora brassicae]|uniref:PNPLA domain-containing protein n=1 Tax=Plasmodiophora brassicae TaxID=37360 RepID=A0A3P3YL38_PLABS|nr:unnamed protein product [Plasmodiophora brassicae]